MATVTIKDRNDVDVVFTQIGEDLKNQQFVAFGKTDDNTRVGFSLSQDKPALNSKASHRITIKPFHQELDGTTGIMTQGSVSVLVTIPPGMALDSIKDLAAYAANVLADTATVELLAKGGHFA